MGFDLDARIRPVTMTGLKTKLYGVSDVEYLVELSPNASIIIDLTWHRLRLPRAERVKFQLLLATIW